MKVEILNDTVDRFDDIGRVDNTQNAYPLEDGTDCSPPPHGADCIERVPSSTVILEVKSADLEIINESEVASNFLRARSRMDSVDGIQTVEQFESPTTIKAVLQTAPSASKGQMDSLPVQVSEIRTTDASTQCDIYQDRHLSLRIPSSKGTSGTEKSAALETLTADSKYLCFI